MNYEFQLENWLSRIPLRVWQGHYEGSAITGPCDICNIELLRRGMMNEYHWGEPVPVDVFVMAKGEPENRTATKIGGLPFRSRRQPWPCTRSGHPMAFIAQFNFLNSFDIVGKLPGDLLLIFGEHSDGRIGPFHMEWKKTGIDDLVRIADVPSGCMRIAPCFGYRCRMMSYPNARLATNSERPRCQGKEVWADYHIPQLQATQIGRSPFFIQSGDDSLPGRILCTVSSVQPDPYKPYPWVNVPDPLCPVDAFPPANGEELMISDMGCIYVSITEDGALHTRESSF